MKVEELKSKKEEPCKEHDYYKVEKRINNDNEKYNKPYDFYFVTRKCKNCKESKIIEASMIKK